MQAYFELKDEKTPKIEKLLNLSNNYCPAHFHSNLEMVYCKDGEITIMINETGYECKKGDFCFANSYDIHSYHTTSSSEIDVFVVPLNLIPSFTNEIQGKNFASNIISGEKNTKKIKKAFKEIITADENNLLLLKGNLYIILSEILEKTSLENKNKNSYIIIKNILTFIEENFTNQITLDSISKKIGYNKYYISHVFNQIIGTNINDYINSLRVRQAVNLISAGNTNISDICFSVGFNSQRNFNEAFKKYFHKTPSDFIKNNAKY